MAELTLPLGTHVTYRGMTGRDEDILTNQKKFRSGDAIDEVMASCVQSVTTGEGEDAKTKDYIQVGDIRRLKTPERIALLYAIRQASYGDTLEVELRCTNPSCGEEYSVSVDLKEMDNIPCPADYAGDGFEVAVEDAEGESRKVIFDYMDGRREQQLAKQTQGVATFAMLARIKEVEGVHKNDIKQWLLDLPVRQRQVLRKKMADFECGLDTELRADCTFCGTENSFQPHGTKDFFFPEV